jgi:hypothetical protein
MATGKRRVGPGELGIDVGKGTDAPAFRWLVACLLFGNRISQDVAAHAYRELDRLHVLTPKRLADADWQELVDALGRGGYKHYDESTARELIGLGRRVTEEYGGHLARLKGDVHSRGELTAKAQEFTGIGPTTARIFVRELAPVWGL